MQDQKFPGIREELLTVHFAVLAASRVVCNGLRLTRDLLRRPLQMFSHETTPMGLLVADPVKYFLCGGLVFAERGHVQRIGLEFTQ